MTSFPDLSPYDPPQDPRPRVRVGWLGADVTYPTGSIVPAVCDRLAPAILKRRQNVGGSMRQCELCESPADSIVMRIGVQRATLGLAEVHIDGEGFRFVAPDLILHYIVAHHYAPPAPFIEAVLALKESVPSGGWRVDRHAASGRSPVEARLASTIQVSSFQPLPPHEREPWSAVATVHCFDPEPSTGGSLPPHQAYATAAGLVVLSGRAHAATESAAMQASLAAALDQLAMRAQKR